MKYLVIFLIVCVAMAAAAPQIFAAVPGYAAAVASYPAGTLVAGPTVINGITGRYVYPGYVGPAII